MKQIYNLFIVIVVITILGCKPPITISNQNYQEHQFLVATANDGYSLDMPTVYDALYKSRLLESGGVLEESIQREFIDSLVLDSMIGFEGRNINLPEHYSQYRMFKIRYYDILIKQFLQKMVYEKAEPDSLEVVEYYYANEDLFAIEEQIELFHILIDKNKFLASADSSKYKNLSPEELDSVALNFADSVKSLITSTDKFPEIAAKFSDEETATQNGGYVGWTKRNKFHPPFDSVAFALRKGDISEPYTDGKGWHILMANEYYPAGFQPLNENLFVSALSTLRTVNTNKIGKHLIDSLLSRNKVEANPEILHENIFLKDGQTWAAVVNGIDTIDCNEARSLELSYRDNNRVENTTPEMKVEMFNKLGEKYALIQAARNVGIEKDSAVLDQFNKLSHKYQRDIVAQERVDIKWGPADSSVEQYYHKHINDFTIKKPLKVQHIIAADSVFGLFLKDQAMSGVDFLELAKEYYPGEESIRTDLADLGYIDEKDVSKEFYHEAMKTDVGAVSFPVKTEFGYHVIKVLEKKSNQSLVDAKRDIVPILKKEHAEEVYNNFKDKLFTKYNVKSVGKLHPVHLKPKNLRK